jgi:hypothetical protein
MGGADDGAEVARVLSSPSASSIVRVGMAQIATTPWGDSVSVIESSAFGETKASAMSPNSSTTASRV